MHNLLVLNAEVSFGAAVDLHHLETIALAWNCCCGCRVSIIEHLIALVGKKWC